jgi:hypothetical protein
MPKLLVEEWPACSAEGEAEDSTILTPKHY